MDTSALISIRHIVASLQNEMDDYRPSLYKRLTQLVIEGLSDLNIFYAPSYKVSYPVVSDINTVDVPEDYVDYYRIGVVIDGKIWTLTQNNDIPLPNAISCGEYAGDSDNMVNAEMPWEWHYSFSGGVNFGYHRYDANMRRIVLSGDMVGRQIVLEYVTTGIGLGAETLVPRQVGEVIKSYAYWKSLEKVEGVAMNLKQMAEMNYNKALVKYQRREWSFTMDEFLDAIRSGYSQTIKR